MLSVLISCSFPLSRWFVPHYFSWIAIKLLPGRLDHDYKSTRYCDHQPTSNPHSLPVPPHIPTKDPDKCALLWKLYLVCCSIKGLRNVLKGYHHSRNPTCCLGAGYFPWLMLNNTIHSRPARLGLVFPPLGLNSHDLHCSTLLALWAPRPTDLCHQLSLASQPQLLCGNTLTVSTCPNTSLYFQSI